jgi:hypothetical protein
LDIASEFNHGGVTFLKKPCIMASLNLSSTKRCAARRMGRAPNRSALELPSSMTRRMTDESTVIVSHMGLIVGCAAPLWISDCIQLDKTNNVQPFLQLWGVLSLGVGDAMGAVVGKFIGLLAWGQGRTIEGSMAMAMLLSMSSICLGVFGTEQTTLWLPAVVFATLVEAFTLQIDNVVLPLAGASIILLSIGSQ